jgi:fumarate reductase flavoprotein subunit
MTKSVDVLVIGGGGAGMTAALFAQQAGASVLILEADDKLGGATALSEAVIYAAGTSAQRKLGIHDNADAMYSYLMTLNAWQTRSDIMRILSDRSAEAIEWLIGLGIGFDLVVESGVDGVGRGHCANGGGEAVCAVLADQVATHGIEVMLGARADRLLMEEGRVAGVHVNGMDIRAKAVVIATGGFGNSLEMLRQYYPKVAQHGEDWIYAMHNAAPFILGDGLKMGSEIGAEIAGSDTGLATPSAGLVRYAIEAYLPQWIMIVNDHGRRFMPENISYTVTGYLINEQPGAHAWAIISENALRAGTENARELDPYNTGRLSETWNREQLNRQADLGRVKRSSSLEGLAAATGIDPLALVETVGRYNSDAQDGIDREWSKQLTPDLAIRDAPFYAVEIRASVIGQTGAGLVIDGKGRVRDIHGRAIPGVYAAGETLGCVQGRRYAGGGMGVATALVFGRLAGEEAARFALT